MTTTPPSSLAQVQAFMQQHPWRHRLALLSMAAHSPPLQALLREWLRRDIHAWFALVAWTFDPRTAPHTRPFILYPFQQNALKTIQTSIHTGTDLLIEKSRDMGASWLVLHTFLHAWLFEPGAHCLVGSRKQDYVDNKGDRATLFEKLRFALAHLPPWLLPAGFNLSKHAPLLKLINPANGNTIVGESSNAQFSRGGRYKAILMDEFPFWPHDDSAYAAAGQSTPCRILVGTPYGKHNAFARLRFSKCIPVLALHWQLHPHKDDAWYQQQCQRMGADAVARELDMNYNLSVSNRVFADFGPQHSVEQLDVLPNRRIVRTWDFGYHCPAVVLLQIDDDGVVRVLREILGHQTVLTTFAQGVLELCQQHYPHAEFDDICDPAGGQKNDKGDRTSIDILNSLGVYPFYKPTRILRGLALIRTKLLGNNGTPHLLIDRRHCKNLIDAFEGGYRYASEQHELPMEEHPFEDVMDCLRYAIVHKCDFSSQRPHRHRPSRLPRTAPQNPYTGY